MVGETLAPAPETLRKEQVADTSEVPLPVRASLVLSFAERYLGAIVQLVATVVLVRILTPRDYGVYTVTVAIVGLTAVIRDFGAVSFLFQARDLSSKHVQTVYGTSLLFSFVTAIAFIGMGGPIARFYGAEGIRSVLRVISFAVLLAPYSAVVITLLRREMNFRAVLLIEFAAALAGATVAIGFAMIFGGFMSLAWGALATAATSCVMAAKMRPARYSLRPSLREWRRILPFGAVSTAGFLLREIGTRSPELVIGRLLGMEAVGFLTRADSLVLAFEGFIRGAVTPVAVSSFAAQHRRGESIRDNFRYATEMWTGLAWPFFAVLCVLASPTVRILFGPGWEGTIPILRLYSVAAGISALTSLNWNAYQAMGAVSNLLRIQLVIQPVKIALVIAASFVSLLAVAVALIAAALFSMAIAYQHAHRLLDTSLADALRAARKSIGVTAFSIAGPLLALTVFGDNSNVWLEFLSGAFGAGAGWFLGLWLFDHPIWPEITLAAQALRNSAAFLLPGRSV
jgi:O-antigen/teichoic acid export membrane protein